MSGAGIWIEHARFNGGPMQEAGPSCRLALGFEYGPQIVLPFQKDPGPAPPPTGLTVAVYRFHGASEHGLLECWGPNNPGGILDPVNPWGYVRLPLLTWKQILGYKHPDEGDVQDLHGTISLDAARTEATFVGTILTDTLETPALLPTVTTTL